MELKSDTEVPTTTIFGRIAHGKVPCATLESFSVSQLQKMSELDQSDDLAAWGCIQKNSRFFFVIYWLQCRLPCELERSRRFLTIFRLKYSVKRPGFRNQIEKTIKSELWGIFRRIIHQIIHDSVNGYGCSCMGSSKFGHRSK